MRVGDRTLMTPFIGVRDYYDSLLNDTTAVGLGPGVWWRRWFGGSRYAAPSSCVEGAIGYGLDVSGDDRARGLFATLSVNC